MPTYREPRAPGGAGGGAMGYHGRSERYPDTSIPPPAQAADAVSDLVLRDWRPLVKNSLRGFATVELPIVGLVIRDVAVLFGSNGLWALLPAKPQVGGEGRFKLGPNGKPAYSTILEWRDRQLADRFSASLIAAIRDQHPGALEG